MRPLARLTLAALIALVLAGCAKNTLPSGPLTQQDTEASLNSISDQLQSALERSASDAGVRALSQFPAAPRGVPSPLGDVGYTASLPRGTYHFEPSSESWVLDATSNDLELTWPYQGDQNAADNATLLLDWDASSPTREVVTRAGVAAEVPTDLHLSLEAADGIAAELDARATYYESAACPAGIADPTSVTLDSEGTYLKLENVGFKLTENGSDAALETQGKAMLTQSDIYLDWDITVNGGLGRSEDCYSELVSFSGGSFAAELGGFTGDTRSLALRFAVEFNSSTLSDGAFVINGDESQAITFSGTYTDDNGNGIPGDDLTVTYPDGTSSTLEDLLGGLEGGFRMLRLLRP